jgi:beta-lactamase class A
MLAVVAATMAIVSGGAFVVWGIVRDDAAVVPAGASSTTGASRSATPAIDSTQAARAQRAAERGEQEKALTAALDAFAAKAPDFAVAVRDNTSGEVYSYNSQSKFETASAIKVDILAALLLDTQDDHRILTSTELGLARKMIQISDNGAANALFGRVGYRKGLTAANKRLGLTQTPITAST